MVIFGLKKHDTEPLPRELIAKMLSILKNVSNIDICIDFKYKPLKNKLDDILWRIEAKMIVPNVKELTLPLFTKDPSHTFSINLFLVDIHTLYVHYSNITTVSICFIRFL